jgi:regulator of extracellular matrix RemA (YlzA/DUF370 family)
MKLFKSFSFVILSISVVSCSSDNQTPPNNPPEISFDYYTEESFMNDGSDYSIKTGNIDNSQLQSVISVGTSGIPYTELLYNYDGTYLQSVGNWTFYYDSDHQLIGSKKTGPEGGVWYVRYVNVSPTVVYRELMTLPLNDPATQIDSRCIVELDENNNIIKAGQDSNLDGIRENTNEFGYADGDLISVQPSGNSISLAYSDIIDSKALLMDKTYGKRTRRIIYADQYSKPVITLMSGILTTDEILNRNYHLSQEAAAIGTYEIAPNGCYSKHTVVYSVSTNVTTYFFN